MAGFRVIIISGCGWTEQERKLDSVWDSDAVPDTFDTESAAESAAESYIANCDGESIGGIPIDYSYSIERIREGV